MPHPSPIPTMPLSPETVTQIDQLAGELMRDPGTVLMEWDRLVIEQPWFSLPRENRFDNLPGLIISLARMALDREDREGAARRCVEEACAHGEDRREQGLPEHLMFTEYHLLRQAIWHYLTDRHPPTDGLTTLIFRIDAAITIATNASMWGYHRSEIEAMGKWSQGIERIVDSAAVLSGG